MESIVLKILIGLVLSSLSNLTGMDGGVVLMPMFIFLLRG
jgi:uncharacterized membrane protein YfcA